MRQWWVVVGGECDMSVDEWLLASLPPMDGRCVLELCADFFLIFF